MAPVRLEPTTPHSQVKHSTTEPLRSLKQSTVWVVYTESISDFKSVQWCNSIIKLDRDQLASTEAS